jgi:hypothetical protein
MKREVFNPLPSWLTVKNLSLWHASARMIFSLLVAASLDQPRLADDPGGYPPYAGYLSGYPAYNPFGNQGAPIGLSR